eukprot:gene5392-1552_t
MGVFADWVSVPEAVRLGVIVPFKVHVLVVEKSAPEAEKHRRMLRRVRAIATEHGIIDPK